ncbi:GNAT family N-acetyltransferase [Undibacterium sp. Ji42W]|uniref:GNAT family N-acetyltransferase n=1 Tax=Undibacterium sp. Ji42W TaxID=3413039 RepID=UPI003BEFE588
MHTSLPPRVVADALWLLTARSRGGRHWLHNATCDIQAIEIAGQSQPVSLLDSSNWQESYVASPRSTWLRYPRQELLRGASPAKAQAIKLLSCPLLGPLSALFKASKLDQAAIIANHLVSTNLYADWSADDISQPTDKLTSTYPQRPLMMRNICPQVNPELAASLLATGWQLLPSRMIYLCDPQQGSVWKHNHVKQDARLLDHPEVEVLTHEQLQMQDVAALQQLYRQLFIDKHSYLNPDFTAAFFALCLETQFLEMHVLRWQGRLVGVLGIYTHQENGWLTTPLIGYDTSLPKELGLYRRLMALLLKTARDKKLKLHYSSGASQFKRARGGIPQLEYTAIYNRHLSTTAVQSAALFTRLLTTFAPAILKKADRI